MAIAHSQTGAWKRADGAAFVGTRVAASVVVFTQLQRALERTL